MKRILAVVLLTLCFGVSAASAAPVTVGSFGTIGAFWANRSYDGSTGLSNVGHYLTNTPGSDVSGFYNRTPALNSLSWLGTGTSTFLFDITQLEITHLQSVTGWPSETWGIYQDDVKIPLGTAPRGGTGTLTTVFTSSAWGFYMVSGEGRTWYSGALGFDGRSHFALFQGENPYTWYLGIEDATFTTSRTSDWDYNDVILRLEEEPTPVPEPGGMTLMGMGLLAIARFIKKWKV